MERYDLQSFYNGKKVLITGNTGFKGAWMSQMLIDLGAEVIGIALEPQTNPSVYEILGLASEVKTNILDIRDFESVCKVFKNTNPDMVFHLAAQPIVIDSYDNPRYTYDVNVMGTVNICECVRMSDSVQSFVNVTTDKVYRNNEWEFPYREIDYLDGYDPYSNSKSCSELLTASYKRAFFNERKIPVSTCRAGNVIGGGDYANHRILPDCVRAVTNNTAIEIRNPNSVRPYQHVLEAIAFYLLVAKMQLEENRFAGEYNVGPDYSDCLSSGEVAELFCAFWGEDSVWKSHGNDGPHEANLLRLDTSKAKETFGWKPVWNAREAIEQTVRWYKAYYKKSDMRLVTEDQIREYLSVAMSSWRNA